MNDIDIMQTLGINEDGLRTITHAGDAKLTVFLNEPVLSNLNCRRVSRNTGALGESFMPEPVTEPSDGTKASAKNNKRNDDGENDGPAHRKAARKTRVRISGSARKNAKNREELISDVDSVVSEWTNEADFGDDSVLLELPPSIPRTTTLRTQPGFRQHIQGQAPVLAGPGMSPNSVQIRIDAAANAARNEMLEQNRNEVQQREKEKHEMYLQLVSTQRDAFNQSLALQASYSKKQEDNQSRDRISEAFTAHPDPSSTQLEMFRELVRSNVSPGRLSRASTGINFPRQSLQFQVGDLEVEAVVAPSAPSAPSQLALQDGT